MSAVLEPEAVYGYVDERGQLLFEALRLPGKRFVQRRPDGNGDWIYNLNGTRRVLFHLPDLLVHLEQNRPEPIYVVEGEKDVLAVEAAGETATCNPMGAGKWEDDYSEMLQSARRIVVVADRDEPGRRHALAVAESLRRIIHTELVEPLEGNDVSDHLAAGFTLEELEPLALEAEQPAEDGPVFIDLREIEAKDIVWLERPFLPAGELVTNNAKGDTGKGLYSVHIAARISRGELGERPMVLFAVAEDAFETVLKPRLLAAEADLAHVRALSWQRQGFKDALLIPDDIPRLKQAIDGLEVGMLVIDPLLSHLSAKTKSHIDHEVKIALRPLVELAHDTGCLVLGNGHFTKDTSRGARDSAQGSAAFTNTPRVALAMAYDDDDPDLRIVEVVKSNVGPKGIGRNYRIKTVAVEGLSEPQPLLVAEHAATKSVDDLLAAEKPGKRVPGELLKVLVLEELEGGERSRKHLDTVAKEKTGASADSLYKSALDPLHKGGRIKPRKDGLVGGWFWRLEP